jgi:hypothetical protein
MAAQKLSEEVRLTALAYLYQGKTPREVETLVKDISYAQALRLKKELEQSKEDGTVADLFNLSGAAIEIVLEQAKAIIEAKDIPIEGTLESVEDVISSIKDDIQATKILKAELAEAGTEVVKKIKALAKVTNSSEVILNLAEALSKMQGSYFRTATVTVKPDEDAFQEFLQKP